MRQNNCFRQVPLSDNEMANRVCTFPENSNLDWENGDNSLEPCMRCSFEDITLTCKQCTYCEKRKLK